MKNMRFLALAAVFVTGSIVPMGSFGPSGDDLAILAGGLVGAGALAVLGVQKGMVLAKAYEQSLGILATPAGALVGGSVGVFTGAFAGFAVTGITLKAWRAIHAKIKQAKIKLEKMKQQYL